MSNSIYRYTVELMLLSSLLHGCYADFHVVDELELSKTENSWSDGKDGDFYYDNAQCKINIIPKPVEINILPQDSDARILELSIFSTPHDAIYFRKESVVLKSGADRRMPVFLSSYADGDYALFKLEFDLNKIESKSLTIEISNYLEQKYPDTGNHCLYKVPTATFTLHRRLRFGAGVIGHYDPNVGLIMFLIIWSVYLLPILIVAMRVRKKISKDRKD